MPNDDTLLAYLVASFPGRTEDIATEALRHILDHSDASMEALNDVVQSGVRGARPITSVKTRVTHADGTKPDMVGFDETGTERALIEVKFWAELTPRQPNGYINRLPDDGPSVLMFLAPEGRIEWLWPQLKGRLAQEFSPLLETDSERKSLRVGDTERHLMIVSWGGLLDSMAARCVEYDEAGVGTEIRQLRSLAKYADAGAFKPIRRGEEFGADSEVRLRQYKRLIDAVTERGIEQEWVSRKGLNRTPRSYGYGRYIRLYGTMVWFGVNVDQFERIGNTPLWVDFIYSDITLGGAARTELGMRDAKWAPVNLKRDVEYPEMLDGVVDNLKRIADVIHEQKSASA